MDQNINNRDTAHLADRSSQSTATFSATSSSDIIPSTVIVPKASHLQAGAAAAQPAATAAAAAVASSAAVAAPTVSRWSAGTFGSAAAPGQSLSEVQAASSTYSGESAKATTAQVATPTVLDLDARRAKNDGNEGTETLATAPDGMTSADLVGLVQGMNPADLQNVLSSGRASRAVRGKEQIEQTGEE